MTRCRHANTNRGRERGCHHCTQIADLRDTNAAIDARWKAEGRCFTCAEIHKGQPCPRKVTIHVEA